VQHQLVDSGALGAGVARRHIVGAGLIAMSALALAGCSSHAADPVASTSPALPTARVAPTSPPAPVRLVKHQPPRGTIDALPIGTRGIAWTVDDGIDSAVVEAYARFAALTGTRLTFFLNGVNRSWTEHADLLRPLVRTGQVQLGNHTWNHPALTALSDSAIEEQLQRNHEFIASTYGVDARPYYRPPFGYHDRRVDAAAARVGYTTPVLWYGTLADSGALSANRIVANGRRWFLPAHLVIGHANHPGTIGALPRLHRILEQRGLPTYTLDDVFTKPRR
jgi:peptidoglycan/xylan/chitin deacetylase (PgdA/CDA1 family)